MSTTLEIKNRIFVAIVSAVQLINPSFNPEPTGKNVTNALSAALAPGFRLLEIFFQNALKQGNPLTADSRTISDIGSLEDWGIIKINRFPNPAIGGEYEIVVSGNGIVYGGTQYINQETGYAYLVQEDTTITGTTGVVVRSVGAGSDVSLEVGSELYSQQSYVGINNPAIVQTELIAPIDGETIEEYRDDILTSFRITPRGGARGDYILWAKEIDGVRTAYPYSGVALNDMTVYVQETITVSNPQGEASPAIISAVDDKFTLEQPVMAGNLITQSIIRRGYTVDVTNLSDLSKQSVVEETIANYFARKQPFIDGVDSLLTRADRITRAEVFVDVTEAIVPATIDDLQLFFSAIEVIAETLPDGNIPYTSVVNYV